MSLSKIVGIEQEYALLIKGDQTLSHFDASCMLVNAVARRLGLREPQAKMIWDYGHETPYQDIRGNLFGKNVGQQVMSQAENRLINAPLPNGARLYTDHAHPEYSTPESLSALEAVACEKAGEIILRQGLGLIKESLSPTTLSLYKNNTDHQGHSYGCHENYLMAADAHEACLVNHPEKALQSLIPFLVTRQIFAGSGTIARNGNGSFFQISQRADFVKRIFGLETMYARPIINTRQEHHADAQRFRRLHLILGDANMCEFAGFLKLGSTQIVLQMLEDDALDLDMTLAAPLQAMKQISRNHNCLLEMADGRRLSPLTIQRKFLESAAQYRPFDPVNRVPDDDIILDSWAYALDGLEQLRLTADSVIENDPLGLSKRLDWVLKLWVMNRYREGRHAKWSDPLLSVMDLKYHDIDPLESIFYRMQEQGFTKRLLSDDAIARFSQEVPDNTRAWFRAKCIEKFPREISLLNWEVVAFDHGHVHRMVPLLNPMKGRRDQYDDLFDRSRNSKEFINLLESAEIGA